ncbi:hypothetical protein LFM09_01905 [Lentzea alba]|uniref:hypothetical protein n=1 Tax=Lentzea alba TaxID=2714351 RepID=UPI0039BEDA23
MRHAGAVGVWYAALVAGSIITVVVTGWDPGFAQIMAVSGVVPWLLGTVVLWLIGRRVDVSRQALIVMALPIYVVMWFAFVFAVLAIAGPHLDF